jgi:hypothetical protein
VVLHDKAGEATNSLSDTHAKTVGGNASVQTAVCDLVKAQSSLPSDFTVAGVGSNLKGGTTRRAVINITREPCWMGQITVLSADLCGCAP